MSPITAAKRMLEPVRRLTAKARYWAGRLRGWALKHAERTRAGRVLLAAGRFAWSRIPKWLKVVLAAALAVPGPFDEIAIAVVAVFVVAGSLAFSPAARTQLAGMIRQAWEVRPQQ